MANKDHDNYIQELLDELSGHDYWETMKARISQVCESKEECQHAIRHIIEVICTYNYLSLDITEVRVLLQQERILKTFEVYVGESQEDRVAQLVAQMKDQMKSFGNINAVLINFYQTKEFKIKMEEFIALQDLEETTGPDCDIIWGLSPDKQCTDPILRATVLVMHEPQQVKSNKNNQLNEMKELWTKKMYRKLLAALHWNVIRYLRRLQGILLQTAM